METERRAYEEKLLEGLAQLNRRIEVLKIKAEKAEVNAKVEYYKTITVLERKRNKAGKKFQELQGAGAESWEAVKKGADKIWEEIGAAYKDATSKFKSKEESETDDVINPSQVPQSPGTDPPQKECEEKDGDRAVEPRDRHSDRSLPSD